MADIVSPSVRSRMMASIRGKDTKPEMAVRRGLHKLGFRFRLHRRCLPGKPDLVFARHQAVIFVHGCFWHGHGCPLFKWPASRREFWREKIVANQGRDQNSSGHLVAMGWRVCVVWECALKGPCRLPLEVVLETCADWLRSNYLETEIRGSEPAGHA